MKIPFVYGRVAEAEEFTGREKDILRLRNNLTNLVNTIIISPRRWGKSSLVHQTLREIKECEPKILTCHVDIFNCRDEESFYKTYVNAILAASVTRIDEFLAIAKKYIGSFGPKISLGDVASTSEFTLGIDFKDKEYSIDEILDLPEKIARERGTRIIVCIDEFQNIENFDDPVGFQARLRSHWQLHQHACYCLYGSKRHMLMNIFASYEMPFYKFGDIMVLEKIDREEWASFITRRFADTGKHITREQAHQIAEKVECHSYYVQQYSQFVWLLTHSIVTDETLELAFQQMIDRSALLFDNLLDNLKTKQINFLLAIAQGVENFSASATLGRYNLGTSANIKNLRKAVVEKDLVLSEPGSSKLIIQDPILKTWILRKYK